MDLVALFGVKILCGMLSLVPPRLGTSVLSALLGAFFAVAPKYTRIARRNLLLAFPEESIERREEIRRESIRSLARVLVDFARLHRLDAAWVQEHIDCPFFPRFEAIKRENPGKGIVIATGHLGSFELLAHFVALRGHPISFVVRNFTLPRVERRWTAGREAAGNRGIGRKGAFKDIMRDRQSGGDVADVFEENVTRNHAVFVPWFGVPAATTRAVALAALRTEAPVVVAGVGYVGNGRYEVMAQECDFASLYRREDLSSDQKIERMTADMSARYVEMIGRFPGEWFWMHRRWKTRPAGEDENIY